MQNNRIYPSKQSRTRLRKIASCGINNIMIWLIYSFQVLVIIAAIGIIMLQKSGDGIFSSSKVFGMRGRPNIVIRTTYVLGALFLINNVVLGILYKNEYKNQMIKDTEDLQKTSKTNQADQAEPKSQTKEAQIQQKKTLNTK